MEAALVAFIVIGVATILLSFVCCWIVVKIYVMPPPPPPSVAYVQECPGIQADQAETALGTDAVT